MHNIDDCLFRTSLSINIQGDADMTDFETRMEISYTQFANAYFVKLISRSSQTWRLAKRNETQRLALGHDEIWKLIVSALVSKGYSLSNISNEVASNLRGSFIFISDASLREVFADALNRGLILIPYSGIRFKNCALCFCFEFENSQSIHQYIWRTRWALILVNSLSNSLKISKRNFQKAAVIIRHFRKRLFRRPMRQA